jgi:hypothetical protein
MIFIGDRVKVKDVDQTCGYPCEDKGTVIAIVDNEAVRVECDNWNSLNKYDGEPGIWYRIEQCFKLKKRAPKKSDFKIGAKVKVLPAHSRWRIEHVDTYFVPSKENIIPDRHLCELAFHSIVALQNLELDGKVVGYGNDESVRVELDGESILPLYGSRQELVILEDLKKCKE